MTTRAAFQTGQAHQSDVARWARKRLADQGGKTFPDDGANRPQQLGCILADGVGRGKTWEALAATALLLAKDAQTRAAAARRRTPHKKAQRNRQRKAHVLVLVPPGLVSKWCRELRCDPSDVSGFPFWLRQWSKNSIRTFVATTLHADHCYEIHRRKDLEKLPRGRLKAHRYVLPAGTYICNWNVFHKGGKGKDRAAALKRQSWDVVIVDEAHHRTGRAALVRMENARKEMGNVRRPPYLLLLTATPFQLDMTELHELTRHLLLVGGHDKTYQILNCDEGKTYRLAADRFFKGGPPPSGAERRAAEAMLGQLVAITRVSAQKRRYFILDADGRPHGVEGPTKLSPDHLRSSLEQAVAAPPAFRRWYLRERLKLIRASTAKATRQPSPGHGKASPGAATKARTHVAMELLKRLSLRSGKGPQSPRLAALLAWARRQFVEDLKEALKTGLPHKLLVFSHLKEGVSQPLRVALERALREAHAEVSLLPEWAEAKARAEDGMSSLLAKRPGETTELPEELKNDFKKSLKRTPFFDLLGSDKYLERARSALSNALSNALRKAPDDSAMANKQNDGSAFQQAQTAAIQRAAHQSLRAMAGAPLSACYTGDETRRERGRNADAFTSPFGPWILVASEVGSEGIDLQTYSAHLVHFDLEWNPARMEQREGRVDRIGRALSIPASIYYLLVRDTYDERVFHQMIARQRWHGVILGRKALQLQDLGAEDAKVLTPTEARNMALNLDPRPRSKRT